MVIINLLPQTRINDDFITSDQINATPVDISVNHPLVTSEPNSRSTRYTADFYSKIGLDIVTETVFHYPYPYISEKTIRPINCKRMFIIVGAPYTLELLHSKGIKTFDDIIDESYDRIVDPEKRFFSIINSIENFCALDLMEIKQYYNNNCDKFSHNWHTLKNLPRQEIQQFIKAQ